MHRYLQNLQGLLKVLLLYPVAERVQKRHITPKLRMLRAEAAAPFAQRKAVAKERLIGVLSHAKATVPYYHDLFTSLNFDPECLRKDMRYFEDVPFLTKDILREQGRRLISSTHADAIVREQKTGSSTGLAATIYYDQEGLDWTAAQNIMVLGWGGKRRYHREAHLSTLFAAMPPEAASVEAKKCFVLHRKNIYTEGFGNQAQLRLLEDLQNAKAVFVQGHPSSMFALARYLEKQNKTAPGLFEVFVSTGELLTAEQRVLIEKIFSARVSNRYGACEFGVMAQELATGPVDELLVSDSLVWPETIDSKASEPTELVFTNLRNPVMPLIRYRMGDVGKLAERNNGWWITDLAGRTHDAVNINGSNYPTHYVQDILDRCGPIDDFQILVANQIAKELRLVVNQEQWEQTQQAVKKQFPTLPLRRIDPEDLVFVGIRGKFSYIIRENA